MRRLPLRSATVATLALALIGVSGPVQAAPTWLPATGLGASAQTLFDVALNARGDAVAVGMTPGVPASVLASTRTPGGGWSAPQTISAVGQSSGQPDVAIGADGTAVAVWLVANGSNQQAVAAVRPPGGAWSGSELVSGAATTALEPHVGVDGTGTALVVFSDGNRIQATSRPAGGAWSMPTSISGSGSAARPRLSVADSGHAVAAWEHSGDGTNYTVSASVRAPEAAWLPPNPLTAPYASGGAFVATDVNNHGDAVVEFVRPVGGVSTVHAVVRRGGAWTAAQTLSTAGVPADGDSAAIGDDGTVVVPFLQDVSGSYLPVAAARRPDGVWDAPQTLSTTPATEFPLGGVDAAGNATVAWAGPAGGTSAALTSRRAAGAAWSAAEVRSDPSTAATQVHLAQSPTGDALVGWTSGTGATARGNVAVLDGAGPSIADLVAPSTGAVGAPSDFSAAISDAWSEVSDVTWNFSDGAAGTGTAPSHVWSTAGTHTVTVTATDAFGNTSRQTTRVEVVGTSDVTAFKLKPRVLKLRGTRKQTRVKAKITLSSAAKVTLTFTPKKARKGKKKPKVYAVVTRNLRGGTTLLKITAKVGGKKLKPGKYKVVAYATTAAGKGRSRKVVLRVVR